MRVDQYLRQRNYLKETLLRSLEMSDRKGRVRFLDIVQEMASFWETFTAQLAAHDFLPEPEIKDDGTPEFSTEKVALLLNMTTSELEAYMTLNPHRSGDWEE